MPVELPDLEPQTPMPSPPTAVVWMPVLVLFMIAGAAIAVFTTTAEEVKAEPVLFWFRLIGLPPLVWCMVFGLRQFFFDTRSRMRAGEIEARQEAWDEAVSFGRDPLAVTGLAMLCAFPEGTAAQAIAAGQRLLQTRETESGKAAVRYTTLGEEQDSRSLPDRYAAAFEHLLERLAPQLWAIPPEVPFGVHLQVPAGIAADVLLAQWSKVWSGQQLFPATVTLLPEAVGMMALDKWLDYPEGAALERFELVVAVQLYEEPPVDSAEAAVGMVLAWSYLAAREGIAALAHIHRPVSARGAEAFPRKLEDSLRWGRLENPDVQEVWQADETGQDLFLKHAGGMAVLAEDGLKGVHDIGVALGYAGGATEWLALALAVEQAAAVEKPQCVVCGHAGEPALFRLAVVQPAPAGSSGQPGV